jgi:two-component system cell cycle response regulator
MSARVLVIEDNAANLELMTYLLKAFGHTTLAARDGEEGVALARRSSIDLIVCDIQLPKLDGYEVARQLKSDAQGKAVPMVAVTAFAMVGDREKVVAAGFEGYITKPIVPETFVREIEAFLPPMLRSVGEPVGAGPSGPADPMARRWPRSAEILVVDNVEANIALMRSLLEPYGYRVRAAGGLRQALDCLTTATPDLILSDVHLGDGTGYDLITEIRRRRTLAAVPFVFLSSTGRDGQDRARGLSLGARRFILRPIDPPALLAEIEACLGRS